MTLTLSNAEKLSKIILVDIVLLVTICLVPALSHLFALPLYKLNPMLLSLLAGMLLVRDRRNAYLLAILLPLCSMLTTGMPVPLKAACMIPEMLAVVALFQIFERRMPMFVALFVAIVLGKVVFYGMKALLIAPLVLIETDIWLQLGITIVYAIAFTFLRKRV